MTCNISPYEHPRGPSLESVELNSDSEFLFTRTDGPRRPVRSVDSAIVRQTKARILVMKLALG